MKDLFKRGIGSTLAIDRQSYYNRLPVRMILGSPSVPSLLQSSIKGSCVCRSRNFVLACVSLGSTTARQGVLLLPKGRSWKGRSWRLCRYLEPKQTKDAQPEQVSSELGMGHFAMPSWDVKRLLIRRESLVRSVVRSVQVPCREDVIGTYKKAYVTVSNCRTAHSPCL